MKDVVVQPEDVTDDASSLEAKRQAVMRRLAQRDKDRIQARGDSVRQATKAAADEFSSTFEALKNGFRAAVTSAKTSGPGGEGCEKIEIGEKIEEASGFLHELQKLLNGRCAGLPPYYVQQLQSELDGYYSEVTSLREARLPKKKFGFKKSTTSAPVKTVKTVKPQITTATYTISSANEVNITGLSNCEKVLEDEDVTGKDVCLTDLRDTVVTIYGTPGTLHVTNVENCKILTGPVRTSIFVEFCSGTEFQIACQQLRIHSSTDCRFFTYVASRAIIEDCKNVEFAPYAWEYDRMGEHFRACGFDREKNNWRSVDDFNWLALDKPSPNWKFIEDRDRHEKMH
jgi:hypothetical protein